MSASRLEHVNITVKNPVETANMLVSLFDWKIRWQGDALLGGFTIHVGEDDSYIALYALNDNPEPKGQPHTALHGLNHLGVIVSDLDLVEQRVKDAGMVPHNHADYEPGRRFYFEDPYGLEVEVVSYG